MYKALAILRTLYLVFAVGYTVKGMSVLWTATSTFDEQYARCAASRNALISAAWFAVGWIAFETAIGWILVWVAERRRHAAALRTAAAAQPPPPPAA